MIFKPTSAITFIKSKTSIMNKFETLLLVSIVLSIYSCGPSAKEKEEARIYDSIRLSDSLAMVQAEVQRIADSIGNAEEKKVFHLFHKQQRITTTAEMQKPE